MFLAQKMLQPQRTKASPENIEACEPVSSWAHPQPLATNSRGDEDHFHFLIGPQSQKLQVPGVAQGMFGVLAYRSSVGALVEFVAEPSGL